MKSFLILLLIAAWLVLGYCLEPRLVPHVAAQQGYSYPACPYQGCPYLGYPGQAHQAYQTLAWSTDG